MDKVEISRLFRKAWNFWGSDAQMDMITEECAELIQAVCKLKRTKSFGDLKLIEHVVEEMADVMIMIDQFIQTFNRETVYMGFRFEKLFRLEDRLNTEMHTRKILVCEKCGRKMRTIPHKCPLCRYCKKPLHQTAEPTISFGGGFWHRRCMNERNRKMGL